MTNLGDLPSNAQIPTAGIADDAITAAKIAADAVGSSEIAADAVGASELADSAVVDANVAVGAAIAHTKLASITAGRVLMGNASNVPTATAISGDATLSSTGVLTLTADSVGAAEIATDAVGTAEIAANAVTASEIAADAVGTSEISSGAVTSDELADDAVTSPKLNLTTASKTLGADTGIIYNETVALESDAVPSTGTYLVLFTGSVKLSNNGVTVEVRMKVLGTTVAHASTVPGATAAVALQYVGVIANPLTVQITLEGAYPDGCKLLKDARMDLIRIG